MSEWENIVPKVNESAEFLEIASDFGDPLELFRQKTLISINCLMNIKKMRQIIISKYNLSLFQKQYDALFLFAYNRVALFSKGGAVYNMIDSNNSNIDDWREALINELRWTLTNI